MANVNNPDRDYNKTSKTPGLDKSDSKIDKKNAQTDKGRDQASWSSDEASKDRR